MSAMLYLACVLEANASTLLVLTGVNVKRGRLKIQLQKSVKVSIYLSNCPSKYVCRSVALLCSSASLSIWLYCKAISLSVHRPKCLPSIVAVLV